MKGNQPPAFIGKLPARNRPSYAFQRVIVRYILIFVLFLAAGVMLGNAINETYRSDFTSVMIKFFLSTVTQEPAELSKRFFEVIRLSLPGIISVSAVFASGFTPITRFINSIFSAVLGFFSGLSSILVIANSKSGVLSPRESLTLVLCILLSAGVSVYLIRLASDAEIFRDKSKICLRCGERLLFKDFTFRYILSFPMSVCLILLAGLGNYFIIFLLL